ncbi:MAG: inosine-5-monophosphate dehydrogenase [Candidatus Hecatellales archaeon ex4484_218]|nr:MAG: inosine-5-monophosphate dehydrogenase [Candidatus Hecatellales archaeon ex4484_218]
MVKKKVVVGEIMRKKIVTVKPSLTVFEALRLMCQKNVEDLIIVKGKKPIGILTESDLIKKVFVKELNPKTIKVLDIMSKPLVTVPPHYDIAAAATLMAKNNIRRLPIVEKGKLVGIVTVKELIKHFRDYLNIIVRSVLFE